MLKIINTNIRYVPSNGIAPYILTLYCSNGSEISIGCLSKEQAEDKQRKYSH